MKKIITSLIAILITLTSLAQVKDSEVTSIGKNLNNHSIAKYQLFPTQNTWNFIKLDTQNGRMWQVQFDVKSSNRFQTYLNTIALVDKEDEINDRFTLYPTHNIYNFILLDQIDGRTWQVQWSIEPENRGIMPIE